MLIVPRQGRSKFAIPQWDPGTPPGAAERRLVAAISDLTARQAAVEASLRLMGQTLRFSLLDFL